MTVAGITPFHTYTVSFLAYRIWEEISMYNHITNHWDKEHLMQIDPRYPEVREFMKVWMENWCREHPHTTVVRFTSLFYNFVWIWGSSERNRNLFTDWGSYDFTVSPLALKEFEKTYGYALTAEDFINQGKLQVTHMPATPHKRDWMDFINRFVVDFTKELVEITHRYGKKAYVFYDDSWVGLEPYGERFAEFGFDGLIKCVFSGYEARLCAGVDVPTHEIRLHPYLFPVGLGGAPTFQKGGNPTKDAQQYWVQVRRALLRAPIQRIGLGGYLHLTEDFPDFQDYIEEISDEFRQIQEYHKAGRPYAVKPKAAVLHYWGRLRSWTLSGHFHETYMHDLIHVNEALSGLPADVDFIGFEDVKAGALDQYDIVINAGRAGSAWSGGDAASPLYCFPNKPEDLIVLEDAVRNYPDGAKAYYYLGCLYYDKLQFEKAADLWEKSASLDDSFPTVHRNLALAYYNKQKRPESAREELEKAFRLDRTDARVFFELDQLYKKLGTDFSVRLKNYEDNRDLIEERDDAMLEYVTLCNLLGMNRKAYNTIMSHRFRPWEGAEGRISGQYKIALLEMAKDRLEAKDDAGAEELLKKAPWKRRDVR